MQLAELQAEVAELKFDRSKWKPTKFGEVVACVDKTCRNPAEVGLTRIVGLDNLDPGELQIKRWGDLSDGTSFTRSFRAGQVLFGKRRAYQRKVALADFDGICSGDILVFEPKGDGLAPELLPFLTQSEAFFSNALGTSAGSLSPRTKWKEIEKWEFLLPTKDDQRRIASLLCAVETSRSTRQATIDDCLTLRAAQIGEFASAFAKAHKMSRLAEAIVPERPITYGILKPGLNFPGGVPVIKVRDYPDGFIDESSLLLTDPKIDAEYRRSKLRSGDLLISIRGTVGRIAEVPDTLDGANITQDTARLSIKSEHNRLYVRCLLESEFVQAQIRRKITGLAVQGINIGELRILEIPLPSTTEQESIVERQIAIEASLKALNDDLAALTNLKRSLSNQCWRATA